MTKSKFYLYQHMDSRGGSTLIQASTKEAADHVYCGGFVGSDTPTDEEKAELQPTIEADFEGEVEVILAPGTELPRGWCSGSMGGVELLRGYDGEFAIGLERDENEQIKKLYVVHVGAVVGNYNSETDEADRQALRDAGFPDEIDGLGEDAFGCILLREVGLSRSTETEPTEPESTEPTKTESTTQPQSDPVPTEPESWMEQQRRER